MAKLFSPDGSLITGTLERVPGTCAFDNDNIQTNPDGTYDLNYLGETDLDWDGQETVTREGEGEPERVFVDEDGGEWLESELVLRDEDAAA